MHPLVLCLLVLAACARVFQGPSRVPGAPSFPSGATQYCFPAFWKGFPPGRNPGYQNPRSSVSWPIAAKTRKSPMRTALGTRFAGIIQPPCVIGPATGMLILS